MYNDIYITLSPEEGAEILQEWVEEQGNFIRKIGKDVIDNYIINIGEGKRVIVVVIEYYTWRNMNKMTATVVFDNAAKNTKIHITVGGGSQSVISNYDYGAGNSLEEKLKSLFKIYEVKEMR